MSLLLWAAFLTQSSRVLAELHSSFEASGFDFCPVMLALLSNLAALGILQNNKKDNVLKIMSRLDGVKLRFQEWGRRGSFVFYFVLF